MAASQSTPSRRAIAKLPGLQAERTYLSWTRTSLALLVNGALLLRHALSEPSMVLLIAGGIAFLLALFTTGVAFHRRRTLAVRLLPEALAAPVPVLLVGVGTVGLGAMTLVAIVAG
ncbi:DUF202 domain-containing protein [Salinisphaera sp.]|uniref:DUF202 domain-containing protein n=1 Tax=Salinisphaera sp. TaxID=1914330 RepID=UPI002D795365|nr:DUF202 domain-containing protein [Salinisphaera sp.]HET7314027.1 DUF202 domain-containing protein [Salinisphaera sp.]